MKTRDTMQRYFELLREKGAWDTLLADDMVFTSYTSPTKQVKGREPYLQATRRFYGSISGFAVRSLLVEGDRAVALTRYDMTIPGAQGFQTDVAEIFTVRDGKITTFEIYFDSAPFPK